MLVVESEVGKMERRLISHGVAPVLRAEVSPDPIRGAGMRCDAMRCDVVGLIRSRQLSQGC